MNISREKLKRISASAAETGPPLDTVCQAVVKMARPLLNRFDNAFFALEINLLARQRAKSSDTSVESSVLIMLIIMALPIALAIYEKYFDPKASGGEVGLCVVFVAAVHFVFCTGVALWGASRIFAREHKSGTIYDMLLLPYPPLQWVAMKLVLPLYLLFLSWLTVLPFYGVLLFVGDIAGWLLCKALLAPLWIGCVVLGYTLLLVPDFLSDPPRPAPTGSNERPSWQPQSTAQSADSQARSVLAFAFGVVSFWGWISWMNTGSVGLEAGLTLIRFYDFFAPTGLFWITLNIGFFIAAFARAGAMLSPAQEARRHGSAILWCAIATIYYTGLGFYWTGFNPAIAWGAFLAAPVGALLFSALAARPNDPVEVLEEKDPTEEAQHTKGDATQGESPTAVPRHKKVRNRTSRGFLLFRIWSLDFFDSEREINWLAQHYNNAVFIKDLRIHLRTTSFLSSLLGSVLSAVLVVGLVTRFPAVLFYSLMMSISRLISNAGLNASIWEQEARVPHCF